MTQEHVGRANLVQDEVEARGNLMRDFTEPIRPSLGLEIRMVDGADGSPDSVLVVHGVFEGSAAERGGVEKGDYLVKWNDTTLDRQDVFKRLVKAARIGDHIHLEVQRDGRPTFCDVIMGSTTYARAPKRRETTSTAVTDFAHNR